MKYFISFVVLIFSVNLWASKSRMESLQGSTSGSFLIQDNRNIFLNPAVINNLSNIAFIEWGSSGSASEVDAATTPKAEGGVFYKAKKLNYGIYLGHEDESAIAVRNTMTTNSVLRPDNTLSLFFGTRSGTINLGSSIEYSHNSNETALNSTTKLDRSETFLKLKAGAYYKNNTEGFIHLKVLDSAKGAAATGDKFKGKIGITLGGSHKIGKNKLFAQLNAGKFDWKKETGTTSTTTDGSLTQFEIGNVLTFSKTKKRNLIFLGTSLNFSNSKQERPGFKYQEKIVQIALNLGIEEKIRDWLTLRASIAQGILLNSKSIDETNKPDLKSSNPNSTAIGTGFSINFSPFTLDASLTTTGGTITTSNMFTRVSLSYTY